MLKKISVSLCIALLCMSVCSCAKDAPEAAENSDLSESTDTSEVQDNSDNDADVGDDVSNILSESFPSYDEIQAQYSDKTVLVWTIEETGYDRNYPFRTKEINEYLDEQGCDFAVCFYPVSANDCDFYTAQIEAMAESGDNIDIVFSSYNNIEESGISPYHKYIDNGLFEPLDDYFETETGKKLYDIMPEKHWEALRVNGHIYGIDGAMNTLSVDYGYYVNAELADKYGFDVSLPIEEQIGILEQVKDNESCDVFAIYSANLSIPSYYSDIDAISDVLYIDESDMTVKCVLENETYLSRLRLFDSLNKKGLLSDMGNTTAETFFIMQANVQGGSTIYNSAETVDVDYFGNTVTAIPVFNEKTSVKNKVMATGICSYSKNKDKAFELLALAQTDHYLNDLLTYGLEGTDYNIVDGRADNITNYISIDRFADKMICCPSEKVTVTPEEYARIFENAQLPETIGFSFDGRICAAESHAVSTVMSSFSYLCDGDFDSNIEKLYNKLKESGLQELIDECSRQLELYLESIAS